MSLGESGEVQEAFAVADSAPHSCGPFWRGKFLGIGDVLACDIRRPNQWSGVSPFKGRLMDEIPDAEYKVVEHQIAPPLDPSPRWRFQRLARGTGSGLELVNACRRKTRRHLPC